MFFDNCKLEWFDDGNTTGYITAPKTNPYLFFNCEITGASLTNGLYGRPWDKNAQAIFVNTQTNGRISATGYSDWSDSQRAENAKFKEYANKSGDTAFATKATYDDMTDKEYNSLISGLESTYFGSWTPKYYVPSVVTGVATTKAVIDDTTYQVVYGYVNADDVEKVDTVGYELSTADNLFGKTTAEVNTVYGEVTYTGTDGAEQTINGNGKYIAIIAIEADDTTDTNLYARTYSSNDNGKAYGELSVSSLN
jgi:hypothetical protein